MGCRMTFDEIMFKIEQICRSENVQHLYLFGSYAKGTSTDTSDIDFVVKGCKDISRLRSEVEQIRTLKKIDIFEIQHTFLPVLNVYEKNGSDT